MRSFQHKSGLNNILQSKPVLVLLLILLLVFAWGVIGFFNKMQITQENRKITEEKVAQLQQAKTQLSGNITKLKTEEGLEESIREKFGLAKEGEGVVIIVDDKDKPEPLQEDTSGFFSFFKNWFK